MEVGARVGRDCAAGVGSARSPAPLESPAGWASPLQAAVSNAKARNNATAEATETLRWVDLIKMPYAQTKGRLKGGSRASGF